MVCGLYSSSAMLAAADATEIEALRKELRELRARAEQLERRLGTLESGPARTTNSPAPDHVVHDHGRHEHETGAHAPAGHATHEHIGHEHAHGEGAHEHRWTPADPLHLGAEGSFINISLNVIGAAGTSTERDVEELQLGAHDPNQRGFTLQNAELTLERQVDRYVRGQMNTVLFMTPEGGTEVELEEAYLETLSLPWNLQLKGGHFLSEFGRFNPTHPHAWDFVDAPLVDARFLGPHG